MKEIKYWFEPFDPKYIRRGITFIFCEMAPKGIFWELNCKHLDCGVVSVDNKNHFFLQGPAEWSLTFKSWAKISPEFTVRA